MPVSVLRSVLLTAAAFVTICYCQQDPAADVKKMRSLILDLEALSNKRLERTRR
jgi:hypothetical protein